MRKRQSGPLRFVSYLRCSSDDQAHGDYSTIDTQREINLRHIAEVGGVSAGEYVDDGRSGTNLNRPEWKRLLADAQAGKFDRVCVTYMSRLGRGDAYVIAEHELKKNGTGVELVRESFADDLGGYLGKRMTILMDGVYPKQVSIWTRTKLEQMARKGYRCGGVVPFGYRSEYISDPALSPADKPPPKRLVPDPDAAPFVTAAFELFARTGSLVRVCEYLSAVSPRAWRFDSAGKLLSNEAYRGILVHGDWRNEEAHEAIVPEALWTEVQARRRTRVRAPKEDPTDESPFYLRSLVWCGHCGNRMTPANHHGRTAKVRYYECISGTKRQVSCPVKRVNAASLHTVVIDEVRRGATHDSRMAEIIREAAKALPAPGNLAEQLAAIAKRIRESEKRLRHCLAAVEAGGATLRPLLERIAQLEMEGAELVQQKLGLEQEIAATRLNRPPAEYVQLMWSRFLTLWENGTNEEKSELVGLVVARVEFTEKERGFCRLMFAVHEPHRLKAAASEDVAIKYGNGADDRT